MTDRRVTVEAQWALYGKSADREGYHVLACSTQDLSSANFAEAIARFSPGTPEALPQVTVSYAHANQPSRDYLALAIHNYIESGQQGSTDDLGRPVAFTGYFCLPYQPLAEASVGYHDLYQALRFQRLPVKNAPPLPVTVTTPAPPAPVIDEMATRVAGLLLTGRPVCILGAQEVGLPDRLRFIDTVMSLLPFGMRARMAAATWTRATSKNHRFRLYFSGAARDTDPPDHVVFWGQSDQAALTPEDDYAYAYQDWLLTGFVQPLRKLSGLTQPRSFTPRDVLEVLDQIGSPGMDLRRREADGPHASEPGQKQERLRRRLTRAWSTSAPAKAVGEQFILDCALHLENKRLPQLTTTVNLLKNVAKSSATPAQRERYRALIVEHRLLRHDESLGSLEGKLREALLKLAFVAPYGYESYCEIEEGFGDGVPDEGLLGLIEKAGMSDPVTKALVYGQLPGDEAEKKLTKWCSSEGVGAAELLGLLARDLKLPRHTRLVCEVTVDFLQRMRSPGDRDDVRRALRHHSYLARRLQDSRVGNDQYQINILASFLRAAYPAGLTRLDLYTVMVGTAEPITLAFLCAVLLLLTDPTDAGLARELYMFSSIMAMNIEVDTSRELERLLLSRLHTAGRPEPRDDDAPPAG